MFKFLKSKKGFTLVELMIVVVIMAILVAVAVPIFSAVTKNARTKTCLANQREIQAQFNNNSMSGILKIAAGDKYTLTTNPDGDDGTWACTAGTDNTATIKELFQKAPYCPVENNVITVDVTKANLTGSETESFKITTVCTKGSNTAEDAEVHA